MARLGKDGKIKLTETEIKKQIRSYLKLRGIFSWSNLQGLGSYPGLPDRMGILDDGRFFAVEIKTDKGKLSTAQHSFLKECRLRGAICTWVRSFEEFQKWFEKL